MPTNRAKNSDACVIVYSIADRASFRVAHEALIGLQCPPSGPQRSFDKTNSQTEQPPQPRVPVVLLGNKKDLGHLRQVSGRVTLKFLFVGRSGLDLVLPIQVETSEGKELARRFSCSFCEVSAAEADDVDSGGGGDGLSSIFNQLIRDGRLFKIRQQDANNNAESGSGNGGGTNASSNRQRKRSVFTINRMLGSLIGRNSMPPDLPSARKGGAASQLASSMPNVAGSFRAVFKKRSV